MYFRFLALYVICLALYGCGGGAEPGVALPTASKGYVVYVFARKTEVMIDFCRSDGISRGTKLDVFRVNVPGMDEPVKIGEVVVDEVGKKMSKAKVTAITSSLQMERGDRVFPHPIIIASDSSWIASRKTMDGWNSSFSLDEREWESCEILPDNYLNSVPEIKQLALETGAKPVWHPSVYSRYGEVFFRRAFRLDAKPSTAKMTVLCGGRTTIYLNDRWVGETKEWPEISEFKVSTLLNEGRNLIGVYVTREPRANEPPLLFLSLSIQLEFK